MIIINREGETPKVNSRGTNLPMLSKYGKITTTQYKALKPSPRNLSPKKTPDLTPPKKSDHKKSVQKIRASAVSPIEILRDAELRRNLQSSFKVQTRNDFYSTHDLKSEVPEAARYSPKFSLVDPHL